MVEHIGIYLFEILNCVLTAICTISGEVVAINDFWIIGDSFINKHYFMLPQLKHEVKQARRTIPYLYQFFNVTCYTPNPDTSVRSTLARLVNCVIKALNDAVKLPRLILIIPNSDIVRYVRRLVDPDFEDMTLFLDATLKWVINQMARAVDAVKDHLQRRKPRAVLSYEPKMIWIKMMDKIILGCNRGKSLAFRKLFNDSLENVLSGCTEHFIMDIDQEMNDASYLDTDNQLNDYGRIQFWTSIDKQIERFEKRLIPLKPFKQGQVKKGNFTQGEFKRGKSNRGRGRGFWNSRRGSFRPDHF